VVDQTKTAFDTVKIKIVSSLLTDIGIDLCFFSAPLRWNAAKQLGQYISEHWTQDCKNTKYLDEWRYNNL